MISTEQDDYEAKSVCLMHLHAALQLTQDFSMHKEGRLIERVKHFSGSIRKLHLLPFQKLHLAVGQ